jgi:hypothetical protein
VERQEKQAEQQVWSSPHPPVASEEEAAREKQTKKRSKGAQATARAKARDQAKKPFKYGGTR